ncbi:uncharacterized protein BJ171DRAFT_569886 [Polychytrium aggregatum]|uniref:uncharacterized protein n=1 Tax=Polychytrium aggregatum TaxID=110093 RepID=UPI0022FE8D80|nr:uncharacterized protein BJ171DRAFT_569886 [Polychytrium aggregatum]KAI9202261.1 hypothetical protein BJ171DRAFT_569886 [Polychytrium aggregatum]
MERTKKGRWRQKRKSRRMWKSRGMWKMWGMWRVDAERRAEQAVPVQQQRDHRAQIAKGPSADRPVYINPGIPGGEIGTSPTPSLERPALHASELRSGPPQTASDRTTHRRHIREHYRDVIMHPAGHARLSTDRLCDALSVPSTRTNAFRGLWTVSLSGIKSVSEEALSALGLLGFLGFLDLSFTNVSWKMLQLSSIKSTEIMDLDLFGCAALGTEKCAENRGFAIYILPKVWKLDGILITCRDRKKWVDHFDNDPAGCFSVLKRKQLLATEHLSSRTNSEADAAKTKTSQCSMWGQELLKRMPQGFFLPSHQSLWRITTSMRELDRVVKISLKSSLRKCSIPIDFTTIIAESIPSTEAHTRLSPSNGLSARAILVLLLLGSFWPLDFPVALLSGVLRYLFSPRSKSSAAEPVPQPQHWTDDEISCLTWTVQNKLSLLSLLLGMIKLDTQSAFALGSVAVSLSSATPCCMSSTHQMLLQHATHSESNYHLDPSMYIIPPVLLSALGRLQQTILYACYQLTLASPDYCCMEIEPRIVYTDAFQQLLQPVDREWISRVHLEILHLLCIQNNDSAFLKEFPRIYRTFEKAVAGILPNVQSQSAGRGLSLEGIAISDAEMLSLSMQTTTSDMSITARAFELRYRLSLGISKVIEFMNGFKDTKFKEELEDMHIVGEGLKDRQEQPDSSAGHTRIGDMPSVSDGSAPNIPRVQRPADAGGIGPTLKIQLQKRPPHFTAPTEAWSRREKLNKSRVLYK